MRPVLITGGAGFVGTNLADRLMREGTPVIVYDNLSRAGVERNLQWLREVHGDRVHVVIADVRDRGALHEAVKTASAVFHFAAQVAVTTSLTDPQHDFAVNAAGTLNLLEALRAREEPVPLVFTSTNKVYGGLEDVPLALRGQRYQPVARQVRLHGIDESRPLDFHSPYGCSKGTADQYVLDYARSYGMPTCVFRMSCVYGPHQFGNEDQGWVAHFLIRAMEGKPITLYGDGRQVRDLLFVEDLVEAFVLALRHFDRVKGKAFNVGGGVANTVSLLELLDQIEGLHGRRPEVHFEEWRTGDQRYYVSDFTRLRASLGWSPRFDVRGGLERLNAWLLQTRGLAASTLLTGEMAR
jgi:CDP-paratose 2-epimerase